MGTIHSTAPLNKIDSDVCGKLIKSFYLLESIAELLLVTCLF